MTIKLDIDGVLRNMEDPMVEVYNKTFNQHLTRDDVFTYDVDKAFPLIGGNAFDFFFNKHAQETIIDAKPYEGVAAAVDTLRKYGCKVIIVSYQPSFQAKVETLKWLDRYNIHYDDIIFTNSQSKALVKCDIIIDDRLEYLNECPEEYKICINHAYNKDYEWNPTEGMRFDSLVDWVKYKAVSLI